MTLERCKRDERPIADVRQMNNLRAFMSSENPEVDPTRTADKARDKFVIVQLIINGQRATGLLFYFC